MSKKHLTTHSELQNKTFNMFVYKKRVWAKQCIFVRGKFNKSSLVSVSLWDHARSVSRAGTRTIINLATEDEVRRTRSGVDTERRGPSSASQVNVGSCGQRTIELMLDTYFFGCVSL